MIPDSEVLDAVPQAAAERALQVFSIMKPGRDVPAAKREQLTIVAMARAILAYAAFLASRSHEERMLVALSTNKLVQQILATRSRFSAAGNPAAVPSGGTVDQGLSQV